MQGDGNTAVGDAGCICQAEQLLQFHREHGRLALRVFKAAAHATGYGQAFGNLGVELAALFVVEPRAERL